MGISVTQAKWLKLIHKQYRIDLSKICTLGRLYLYISQEEAKNELRDYYNIKNIFQDDGYSEQYFNDLAGKSIHVDSIDNSNYEGASIIWDMNKPIPAHMEESYTAVIDGGTLEHIFMFPQALVNAMKLVKTGGCLIIMSPCNNWMGHGFYQFSPELFWSCLCEKNGYKILRMDLEEAGMNRNKTFRKISKPVINGLRRSIRTFEPAQLFVVARRVGEVPNDLSIQQDDYVVSWEKKTDNKIVSWENVQAELGEGIKKQNPIRKILSKIKPIAFLYREFFWIVKVDKYAEYFNIDYEIKNSRDMRKMSSKMSD